MNSSNFTKSFSLTFSVKGASQVTLVVKNPPANAGDVGLIPGSGRSPGEGNGIPLQYSCLGNPMDREAWWAIVHGVAKSWTGPKHLNTHNVFVLVWNFWDGVNWFFWVNLMISFHLDILELSNKWEDIQLSILFLSRSYLEFKECCFANSEYL